MPNTHVPILLLLGLALATHGAGAVAQEVPATPPGAPESARTRALEAGAALIQNDAPPDRLNVYIVGFHPMADDPAKQTEAHHFCRQVNEDFMHCAVFDSGAPDANLVGIEYIVSERLFAELPQEERRYWHPHNGEILSGQLVAPGLPGPVEKELMRGKINSYGKTWHVWDTGHGDTAGDRLPLGDPALAWSFNRNGEANPAMVEGRDLRLGVNTAQKRREREDLVPLARPQSGVDMLKGRFGEGTTDIPGAVEEGAAAR